MKVIILHGVNLNMFGKRDATQYGTITLEEINARLKALAVTLGIGVEIFQTNNECEMIERIHRLVNSDISAVIINAGAWTHYSYAIADALAILSQPVVEVHMSNIHAREQFRHFSVLSPVVKGSIAGFGADSYLLGLRAVYNMLHGNN